MRNGQVVYAILNDPDAKVYHYNGIDTAQPFLEAITANVKGTFRTGMDIHSVDGPFMIALQRNNRAIATIRTPIGTKEVFNGLVHTVGEIKWIFHRCFEIPQT